MLRWRWCALEITEFTRRINVQIIVSLFFFFSSSQRSQKQSTCNYITQIQHFSSEDAEVLCKQSLRLDSPKQSARLTSSLWSEYDVYQETEQQAGTLPLSSCLGSFAERYHQQAKALFLSCLL